MKNLANYITLTRMILTCVLFFLYPFSNLFFIVYILCGLSDILDGYVARKTHTQSDFGAKLDTFADFLFVFVMLLKIVPAIFKIIEFKMWIWGVIIIVMKLLSAGIIYLKYEEYGMIHSYMNKFSGIVLLIAPFFIQSYPQITSWIICIVTTIAVVEELLINILHNDLDFNRKSLFGENIKYKK